MKGALYFKLPEERQDFDQARYATQMAVALSNIQEELRRRVKYAGDDVSPQELKLLEELREFVIKEVSEICDDLI